MQLHNLSGKKNKKKRVGRGGKRGTYSGRGGKGQTARAGHRIRPAIRDYLKQIPKRRGRHKHGFISVQRKPAIVSLRDIEKVFTVGETVSPKTLTQKSLVFPFGSIMPKVKILDGGKLGKSLVVRGCAVSASARKAIEAVGGKVL
ncbi:MAG: uL15 family ribosomal protein [bacterium]|nr:uL15 family ribosomal protein [bacterium]